MIKKSAARLIEVLLIAVVVMAMVACGPTQKPGAVPEPYITDPLNDGSLYGHLWDTNIIYGDKVNVTAVELNLSSNITSTSFEYSPDGENWIPIGVDENTSFEGEWFGEEGGERNGIGVSGWNIEWNISDLDEGFYYLRAAMTDKFGQVGYYQRKVYYDPTPPITEIYEPSYGAEISNVTEFKVNTSDEDISYLELEFFNGSGNKVTQKNLGDAVQYNVGRNTDGSTRLDGDNNFCGPAAVANGLWRLAQNNTNLTKLGGKSLDNTELAKALAKKMAPTVKGDDSGKTKSLDQVRKNGIPTDDMKKGVEDYLKEVGLGCDNNETGYSVKGVNNPTWEDYERELKSGQCIILLIAPKGKTSGHYVTGKSANKNKNKDGTHSLGVVDPKSEYYAEDASAKWGAGNNINYTGKDQNVLYMLVVCPKNNTFIPKDVGVCWEPTGTNNRNYISTDGWALGWNTTMVHDGFFLVRAKLVDEKGNTGTDMINTYVNNNPPSPSIIYPEEESVVNGSVLINVTDLEGSEDIAYATFECRKGVAWTEIGNDTDYLDGWDIVWNTTAFKDGKYEIRATMVDYGGKTASDSINVEVMNLPKIEYFAVHLLEGGGFILHWKVERATEAKINGEEVDLVGSVIVTPEATTEYTLTASNELGKVEQSVTVVITPPGVMVTSPEEGGEYYIGEPMLITWITEGSGIDHVDILLSLDGGELWDAIAENQPDTQEYEWTVELSPSDNCFIMVAIYDSAGNELAQANSGRFRILS